MSRSANRSVFTNSARIFNFVPRHGFKLEPRLSYRVKAGRGTGALSRLLEHSLIGYALS